MHICQICKKNPAVIHLTDILSKEKTAKEVHICENCAAEKGFNLKGAASLPQLLGLAAKKSAKPGVTTAAPMGGIVTSQKSRPTEPDLVCQHCGLTWTQFGERGRLGCPHDYHEFEAKLRPLIANQMSGAVKDGENFHVGKRPGARAMRDDREAQVKNLVKRLRAAVAEENYEAAAQLKHELEALRGNAGADGQEHN